MHVAGRAESGCVEFTTNQEFHFVILREDDIDTRRPPLELQEELSLFFEIVNPTHAGLLRWILMETDLKEIEKILHRKGISDKVPDFDQADANGTKNITLRNSGLRSDTSSHEPAAKSQRIHSGSSKIQCAPAKLRAPNDPMASFVNRFNLASSFRIGFRSHGRKPSL
jgi:hypothetical protein